jgi:hypothetical protein
MNFARLIVLVSALAAAAPAADVNGKWKLKFLGDPGRMPKMVSEVILDLKAEGKLLTGTAHAGNWPGDMGITDGKADGDRISFTVVGKSPWQSSSPQHGQASGYPRLTFSGTVDGDRIKVSMLWDSVMIYGNVADNKGQEYELAGERVR